ncbi:SIR2 family protein [Arthrobacter sp. A2-55]|uniref:SIR2 family protein n=1 Tax=Arthrobacter sp. A2-55 TaxID=2897337 RepID=UPI0021CD4F55|nr:SIR2 family protein [Arthrobacter sp. A2-55]MCU6479001.1 DUF4020 domain-containing protein [Arthrobacter sp. A2-55]
MWITPDVNLPNELVEAHREGNLVLFVGAGASVDPPSELPLFVALARRIARESSQPFSEVDILQPDRFLGDLPPSFDVHRRVAAIVDPPQSLPNKLHRAIIELAAAGPNIRIVTTNYDRHLSTAATDLLGTPTPAYFAPALPMGDDFEGIVYLHGSVEREPRHLVVTDEDFGKAYLIDAWAAQFLRRMFDRYTVLFIGYSHEDVVMSYLARGLPRRSLRFAFDFVSDTSKWTRLNIRPVVYPGTATDHQALRRAVEGWSQRSSMRLLNHRQRIFELVDGEPPQEPVDATYLEEVIHDTPTVGFFTERARGLPWLTWLERQPVFKEVFAPGQLSEPSRLLAWWFVDNFVLDPQFSQSALSTLQRMGSTISDELWSVLSRRISAIAGESPGMFSKWVMILVDTAPRWFPSDLEHVLSECSWEGNRETLLLLFQHLTTPRLKLDPPFPSYFSGADPEKAEAVRAELVFPGSEYELSDAWTNMRDSVLEGASCEIATIAEENIRRCYTILATVNDWDRTWDLLSYGRSAIEPHAQDSFREPIAVVIDIARDALEHLIVRDPDVADALIRSWGNSRLGLLRRLSVHGWRLRNDRSFDDKIRWVLNSDLLYDFDTKHEVFLLMAASVREASSRMRSDLLSGVLDCTVDTDHRDYLIFNHLVWLTQADPDWTEAAQHRKEIESANPEFDPREHPDMEHWTSSGAFVPPKPPMGLDELHHLIGTSPSSAIERLMPYRQKVKGFDQPTWRDAVRLVANVVTTFPADGHGLLSAAVELEDPDAGQDFARGTIDGWTEAKLDSSEWATVLTELASLPSELLPLEETARLLSYGTRRGDDAIPLDLTETSRAVARRLRYETEISTASNSDPIDWQTRALTSGAGMLAQFWVNTVATEWQAYEATWNGMTLQLKQELASLVQDASSAGDEYRTVFFEKLHFFFAADETWTCEHLLPMMRWGSGQTPSEPAWAGYLYSTRWNDRMLQSGLLEALEEAFSRLPQLWPRLEDMFCKHLASIAVYSEINPVDAGWISKFIAHSAPTTRLKFAVQIGQWLRIAPPETVVARWNDWIRTYWRQRLASTPLALDHEESDAMAGWIPYIGDNFPEGVQLVLSRPVGLGQNRPLLISLDENSTAERFPQQCAALVAHVLRGTERPFYGEFGLDRLVLKMKPFLTNDELSPIVEEALRLGVSSAPDWLA